MIDKHVVTNKKNINDEKKKRKRENKIQILIMRVGWEFKRKA